MSDQDRVSKPGAADCEELRDLLPAYALGSLDADERARVAVLLTRCPDAASDLPGYQALSTALLFSAPPLDPPADLLGKLLDATRRDSTRQDSTRTPDPRSVPPAAYYLEDADTPGAGRPTKRPVTRPAQSFWTAARVGIGLAAAVSLLLLVLVGAMLLQNNALMQTLQAQTELLNLFARDQVVRFELVDVRDEPPSPPADTVRALVLCHPDERTGLVRAENFPADTGTDRYQVWLWENQDNRDDGGILTVDASGGGVLLFEAPQTMRHYRYVTLVPIPASGETAKAIVRGALYSGGTDTSPQDLPPVPPVPTTQSS